jgi:hypothetical protein
MLKIQYRALRPQPPKSSGVILWSGALPSCPFCPVAPSLHYNDPASDVVVPKVNII